MGKMDVFKARLLNKIGKNDVDDPTEYAEQRQRIGGFGKYMQKINKKTKNWAQKSENAANLLYDLGDYITQQAMKEKEEFTETKVRIGELLKSTAEIQHSMLIKLVEHIVIPAREYIELEKAANVAHRKYVDSSLKYQTAQKREPEVIDRKLKNKTEDFEKSTSMFEKLDKKKELSCPTLDFYNCFKCCFDDSLYLYNDLKDQVASLEKYNTDVKEKYKEQKERREAERRRKSKKKAEVDNDMIERLQSQTKSLPTLPSGAPPVVVDTPAGAATAKSTGGIVGHVKNQDNSTEAILARMRAEKDRIDSEKAAKRRSRAQTILRGLDTPLSPSSKNSNKTANTSKNQERVTKIEPSKSATHHKPPPPPRKSSIKKQSPAFKSIGASMTAYQYQASEESELSFDAGDYIIAISHDPDGWGTGFLASNLDCTGEYPATFVQNFTSCEVTTALYDYEKSEDNELSLKQGDFINVLYKEEGWWLGESNGNFGFFPQNYCQLGAT